LFRDDKLFIIVIHSIIYSKTLAHPASASKSGIAKKILETLKDQENVQIKTVDYNSKPCTSVDMISSQSTVERSSQPSENVVNVEKGGKKRKSTETNAPAKKKQKQKPNLVEGKW
jgi:hypothetical protein